MLTYTLDDVIEQMMSHDETHLSAEGCNAVIFCHSAPPLCKGRTELERIQSVVWAVAGRNVHPRFREQLERLASQELA